MKLYVLWSIKDNKIFAISEYKSMIRLFYLQNRYDKKSFVIYKITDNKRIDRILIDKDDLYLIEYYNDFIIRAKDKRNLDEIVDNYKTIIENTMRGLKILNNECIMSPKEHRKFKKVHSVLKRNRKDSNLMKFINITNIIHDYYGNNFLRNMMNELNEYKKFI